MLNLHEIVVRPVFLSEQQEFQKLMADHHYLGALPKIGETLWYVALWRDKWVALMTFSAAAWKCAARDQWIDWDFHHQYDRLKLVVNNSRFLILPDYHVPNLGTRILSLSQKRLLDDWLKRFGHPVLLLETFVDPKLFQGTVYKAANWSYVGDTKGYRRTPKGYSDKQRSPKMVFVKPLQRNARIILSRAILDQPYVIGEPRIMIRAELMKTLPDFQFGLVQGAIDYKTEKSGIGERLEFSWVGQDEGSPVSGRGWAVLKHGILEDRIYIYMADDSGFKTKRVK